MLNSFINIAVGITLITLPSSSGEYTSDTLQCESYRIRYTAMEQYNS